MNSRTWIAIALGAITVAGGATLWALRGLDTDYRNRIAAQDLGHALRNQAAALFDLVRDVGMRAPDEFEDAELRTALRDASARLAFYERGDGDEGSAELVGWCDTERVVVDGSVPLPAADRVPAALLRDAGGGVTAAIAIHGEFKSDRVVSMMLGEENATVRRFSNQTLSLPIGGRRVWFAPDGAGGTRLHVLGAVWFGEGESGAEPSVRRRHVHASAPMATTDHGADVWVRCDVVDGVVRTDLPSVGAELDDGRPVLDPARFPWSFPLDQDDRTRIVLDGAGSRQPHPGLVALWLLGLLGAVVAFGRSARADRLHLSESALETSHELRTPLTVLRGELEVALRRERSSDEYRRTLETALAEVEGLQAIVTSLLVLGSNATSRHFERVDLAGLVSEQVVGLQSRHESRRVTLDVDRSAEVDGDPVLLERAVQNLLENAAVHSVAGGAIRVAVRAGRDAFEVVVEDEGPGVPAARRDQIFERFFRGPETGARRIAGAGLGLTVVRWVARLHGGDVALDPASGDRARFVFTVPAARSS